MSYEEDKKALINKDWNELSLLQFSGFDIHPYDAYLVAPFALIFITRPKLFISTKPGGVNNVLEDIAYKNMALHPYLSRFTNDNSHNKKDSIIADLLSFSSSSANSSLINNMSFIPIFTNKTRNFNIDNNALGMGEQGSTKHGYRHIYPTHNVGSLSSGTIGLEYNEMVDLEISNLLGIWYNYIVGIVNGELRANPEYVKTNRLDYNSSLYYFRLDRDAKTIKYWSKFNGVFPFSMPSEAFSWQASSVGMTPMNASFSYDSREELTLSILDDFNTVSLGIEDTNANNNASSGEFNIEMFSKINVLNKASELKNKIPLIYYVEDTDKNKKRFILKLGTDSVYKSASEILFEGVGSMGSRSGLYDHDAME